MHAELTDVPALAAELAASGARLIGIAGAPGAGKSTLAEALARATGGIVLPMDGFHLPQCRLVELGRRERMGAPDTFDVEGFVAVLTAVRAQHASGKTVTAPAFDRTIEEPVADEIAITPEVPTVIVEGNYLLLNDAGWQHVAPLLDVTIYLEIDDAVRRDRLMARHVTFGKTPADAAVWVDSVDEANARLVAATAPRATHSIRLP